jgi:hypothetical protein
MSQNDMVRHGDSTKRERAPQGFVALHSRSPDRQGATQTNDAGASFKETKQLRK